MNAELTAKKGVDSNTLKLIAITAMTLDHLTWALVPGLSREWYAIALHIIGRLTAPIMWFFIAEGCFHTRNIKKYVLRLAAFAFISHFCYCFAFGIPFVPFTRGIVNQTGVMLPLALAAALIGIHFDRFQTKFSPAVKVLAIIAACLIAFPADWSSIAVMAPLFIFLHHENRAKQALDIVIWSAVYAAVYFIFIDKLYGILQLFTALSIPLLMRYNGERGSGRFKLKWFFYIYYPAHLIAIGIIRLSLYGDISLIF